MKKHLLILTILWLTLTVGYGQTNVYHPFPDSNAVWIGTSWYLSSPCIVSDDYNLYISGDTTIGIYTYHKLYKNGFMSANCPPPGHYYYGQYWGAFRQDSANKKVYLYKDGVDTLAYNFNLNVGDTLPANCLDGFTDNHIQSIDTILIGNQYRKRFWISGQGAINYTALIEGIGTYLGAFVPIAYNWSEYGNELLCLKLNNQTVWSFDSTYSCVLTTQVDELNLQNKITIYPNPFSLQTTLQIDEVLRDATLTVYNSLGQQIKQIKNISGQTITLYRDNLPSGLYFLQLTQDNKILTTDKIIITDK